MSPSLRLATAGALTLVLAAHAYARGGQSGHAAPVMHRAAPAPVIHRPAPAPVVHRPAPVVRPAPVTAQAPRPPVLRPHHAPVWTPVMHPQPRVVPVHPARVAHAPHHRPGVHGHHHHHGVRRVIGAGAPFYYGAAPVYAAPVHAEPAYAAPYANAEPPLTATYGEPPLLQATACSPPAIHYIGRQPHAGPLPQVIYGVQPPCGGAQHAPAPMARPSPVRAAY